MAEEKILKRIRHLIEKSQSTDSQEEADACMQKVQQLLRDYNIVDYDVTKNDEGDIIEKSFNYEEEHEKILASCIARNNFCFAINTPALKKMTVIGKLGNVDICLYMYQFYRGIILQLSVKSFEAFIKERRELVGGKKLPGEAAAKRKYLNDYLYGAVMGVQDKLTADKKQAVEGDTNVNAIVLHNDNKVSEYVKKQYPNLTRGRFKSGPDGGNGYERGYKDGRGIQTGSSSVSSGSKGMIR